MSKFLELKERDGWEYVSRKNCTGVVAITAFTKKGELILVKQFRKPLGEFCLELPAGLIDKGETAEQAAVRELLEETGYAGTVLQVRPLVISSSAGLTDEVCYSYIISQCEKVSDKIGVDGEQIEVLLFNSLDEVGDYIDEHNLIVDAKALWAVSSIALSKIINDIREVVETY